MLLCNEGIKSNTFDKILMIYSIAFKDMNIKLARREF